MHKTNCSCFVSQQDELVLPVTCKKSPCSGLWCVVLGLVIFLSGLIVASVCLYRFYFSPQVRCWTSLNPLIIFYSRTSLLKFIAIAITIATPCWILHSVFCSLVQVPCIKALCFLSSDPRGQFVPLSGDVRGPPVRPITRKTGAGGERGHLPG